MTSTGAKNGVVNETNQQPGKLFVGGLSFSTTDSTLRQYFEEYGPVKEAVVMRDPSTHRSRGFGFVTYHSATSAEGCMEISDHIVDGRQVEAKHATPREDTSLRGPAQAGMGKQVAVGSTINANSRNNLRSRSRGSASSN